VNLEGPDGSRRKAGLILLSFSVLLGLCLLCLFFVALPVAVGEAHLLGFMCLGAVIALPAGAIYLTVPRMLDRYDPEPAEVLFGCVLWGGIVSCGIAVTINSLVEEAVRASAGDEIATIVATTICAPIVEEGMKGLGVAGVFYFLRREFDGLVDGVIYAFFIALGFAAVENVVYYARAAAEGAGALTLTLIIRGVVAPWGHPVYTAMTGLGFGIARETTNPRLRAFAPIVGWLLAVTLHGIWNGGAVVAGALGDGDGGGFFCFMLLLWIVFVGAFAALIVALVRRRKRILDEYLADEVVLRFVTPAERALVIDAFGLRKARAAWGPEGEELVRTAARLATVKWHTGRAQQSGNATISQHFIAPFRSRIRELRGQIVARQQQSQQRQQSPQPPHGPQPPKA
jgi:RsiW-degrading membrane proteinase PrsW (M82 family)